MGIGIRVLPVAWALSLVTLVSSLSSDEIFGPSLRMDVPFTDHVHRLFDASDGLPAQYVDDLVQTRDGYIWIATNNGLARFDGKTFRVFNRGNSNLPSNEIKNLFEDSQGNLWIATTYGAAVRTPGDNQFTVIPDLTGHQTKAIYEDRSGRILVGTSSSLMASSDRKTFSAITSTAPVNSICEDDAGTIWIGTKSGLFSYQAGELKELRHDAFPKKNRTDGMPSFAVVFNLVPDGKGGIWVATRKGLLHLKDGQLRFKDEGIRRATVRDVICLRDGGVVVASVWGIYRSVDGEQPFEYVVDQRYSHCLLEDSEGGLLIGRGFKLGLNYYQHGVGETLVTDQYIRCVFRDARDNIWLGTRDSGLYRYAPDGEFRQFGFKEGLPDWQMCSMTQGEGDEFWVATRRGIAKWNGQRFTTDGLPDEIAEMNVMNCLYDSNGNIWFSIGKGDIFRTKGGELFEVRSEEFQGEVNWFYEPQPGEIWIGTGQGLWSIVDDVVKPLKTANLAGIHTTHFQTIHILDDGSAWIGTNQGVVRYQDGEFTAFTSVHGLNDEFINRIVADGNGSVWLGTKNSLAVAAEQQFRREPKGEPSQITSRLSNTYRFASNQFGPKTTLAANGEVWISAIAGVLKIPAERPINRVPPRPTIENVRLDGTPIPDWSNIRFSSGRNRLSIRFGVISFSHPQSIRVKYKLDGYDSTWIDPMGQDFADFTDLKPGNYRFIVTAVNEDGIAAVADQTLAFTVTPRWFETVWFRLVAAFSLIGFSILSTLVYTRNVRRRNSALQDEISDRIQAEIRLSNSEQRFRDLAESTHAIPFEANSDLEFSFVGSQCLDVLGYHPADWLLQNFWRDRLHPEDKRYAIQQYDAAKQQGGNQQFDCRMVASDGTDRWIHTVLHFTESDRQGQRVIGFMIDFTVQRNAEQKAERYLDQLERVNRAASMGEMATSIAHEVNQPLFAIVSNAEATKRLMEAEQPDLEEISEALNDIIDDGNRASTIINNVRSLVRKEKQPGESLDLNRVAAKAMELIGPELRRRGLVVRHDFQPNLPTVHGNAIELQQVILNLVLNGAQAMNDAEARDLVVTTNLEDQQVLLKVIDQGTGLDSDSAEQLFEPFFTTKPQGIGMGLAINKTIIEAHQGKIWAAPNPSGGAIFQFVLPVEKEVA